MCIDYVININKALMVTALNKVSYNWYEEPHSIMFTIATFQDRVQYILMLFLHFVSLEQYFLEEKIDH